MSDPNTDPKIQAFLEDFAAVCVKHQLVIGNGTIRPMDSRTGSLVAEGTLGGGLHIQVKNSHAVSEEDHARRSKHTGSRAHRFAFVALGTSAHARLQAAARVATIRNEQENTDV